MLVLHEMTVNSMASRCFWDSESDIQASETFMNVSDYFFIYYNGTFQDGIFAITTIYAVYLYYNQGSNQES